MLKSYKLLIVKRHSKYVLIYIFLFLLSLIFLFPFIYLFLQSFSSYYDPSSFHPYFAFKHNLELNRPIFTFQNYIDLFTNDKFDFLSYFLRSFFLSLGCCIVETLLVIFTAYAFSRLHFRNKSTLMRILIVISLLPNLLLMFALYLIFKSFNITNSIVILAIIYIFGSILQFYSLKKYYDTFPSHLEDVSKIEGNNNTVIFKNIVLKHSLNIVLFTLFTSFVAIFSDFMVQNLIGSNSDYYFITTGLYKLISTSDRLKENFPLFCAASVLLCIPYMIIFYLLKRRVVDGMLKNASKM